MTNLEPVVPETLVKFRSDYPASAPLVHDLENVSSDKQLDALVARFKESRFRWNGRPAPEEDFLKAGGDCEGDCGTIAGAFVATAKAVGFADAKRNDYAGPMYVANNGPVMGGATGNIDGGPDWYFDDHHTATVDGREFDLLFMGKEGKPSYVEGKSERVPAGEVSIEKWTFGTVIVYEGRATELAHRYTRSFETACEVVGANKEWVDKVTKPATSQKIQRWDAIGNEDAKIRRQGIAEYVALSRLPEKHREKVTDLVMSKLTGPIEDDSSVYDILNQYCDDMGEYKEEKWRVFAKENGLSIFKSNSGSASEDK